MRLSYFLFVSVAAPFSADHESPAAAQQHGKAV
jgi:hypothetical protein